MNYILISVLTVYHYLILLLQIKRGNGNSTFYRCYSPIKTIFKTSIHRYFPLPLPPLITREYVVFLSFNKACSHQAILLQNPPPAHDWQCGNDRHQHRYRNDRHLHCNTSSPPRRLFINVEPNKINKKHRGFKWI